MLGFHIPFTAAEAATPATGAAVPELNAWVVVKPDDTVVIRIARVEMGQGTLTGLAQLVAEELDCDWSRVTTEYPTPARTSRATVSGATSRLLAAGASATRRTMSARAVLPPSRC